MIVRDPAEPASREDPRGLHQPTNKRDDLERALEPAQGWTQRARRENAPAHGSNRLIAQLNKSWRVIDDPLQWILQRRTGNPREKNAGWEGQSFCRDRQALLRCVGKKCGEVDPEAIDTLYQLPERHVDWDRRNLDVRGTAKVRASSAPEALSAKALRVRDADD